MGPIAASGIVAALRVLEPATSSDRSISCLSLSIRPPLAFDTENVLSIGTVVKPDCLLVVEDQAAYAPRIYQGESNVNRYLAICNFSLKYMHYANPFIGGLRTGISPYKFSQTKSLTSGPSRAGPSRAYAASVRPCTPTLLITADVS